MGGLSCMQGNNEKMETYVVLYGFTKMSWLFKREAKGQLISTHTLSPGVL